MCAFGNALYWLMLTNASCESHWGVTGCEAICMAKLSNFFDRAHHADATLCCLSCGVAAVAARDTLVYIPLPFASRYIALNVPQALLETAARTTNMRTSPLQLLFTISHRPVTRLRA